MVSYIVLSLIISGIGGSSSNNASHSNPSHQAKAVVYHNNGNPHQNFEYFKNHAIHKFGNYSTDHPYTSPDGIKDTTTADGAHWSKSDGTFVIDTGALAHKTSDKHVQAEACFHQFKNFMKKYEPMNDKNWDGTVVFVDNYGDQITTGDTHYKHLSENGMGFDD